MAPRRFRIGGEQRLAQVLFGGLDGGRRLLVLGQLAHHRQQHGDVGQLGWADRERGVGHGARLDDAMADVLLS